MKKCKYLLIYLIFFVVLPLTVLVFIQDRIFFIDWPGYLTLYVFVVSPFLFIIPYKLTKQKSKKEKIYFILFGFVIPFAIIYFYLFLEFQKNFNPGF